MRKSLFLKSLMTIVLLGSGAALAQPAAGGRAGTFLTPEQRAMFVEQAREQTQNMTAEQRRSWRRDQFTRLAAMSDADKAKSEIIIAKQRNGPTGTVYLNFLSSYTRFENADTAHDAM